MQTLYTKLSWAFENGQTKIYEEQDIQFHLENLPAHCCAAE